MVSSVSERHDQRLERILRAVALEPTDRVPVVLEYSGFAAQVTGASMTEFVSGPARATQIMLQARELVGGGDAVNYGSFWPYTLCKVFGAKVRVPGKELGDNELWQVDECEVLTIADYQRILDQGWPEFFRGFVSEKLHYKPAPRPPADFDILGQWAAAGVPVLSGGDVTTPLELLCGSRSLERFARDLHQRPDLLQTVMDEIVPHLAARACARARAMGFPGIWLGGWRGAPGMLSRPMWERFVWPYMRRLALEIIEHGLIVILHLDAEWTRELERFKELPPKKCLMALDGFTDIWRAREVLDGHMCLMGDVPPGLLAMGTPEQVYDYSRRLVEGLGPEGFILQSGCDIPANAPLANVQAMVAAAEG